MRQQVNLYVDGFETPRLVLSAAQGIALVVVSLVVMVLISGGMALRTGQLENKLAAGQRMVDAKQAETDQLQSQLDARKPDTVLQRKARSLEANVKAKQRLLSLLGKESGGNTDGFSGYLRALATNPVSGIWLTQIDVQNGGRVVNFSGMTTRPENVPVFIQSLGGGTAYAGRKFGNLKMSQSGSQEVGDRLSFQIQSVGEEALQ